MKSKIYFLLLLLFSCIASYAQKTITGHVTRDTTGEAVPGVTVTVKGTKTSTATNNEGRFTINVPNNNAVLVFTSIGYKKQEVPVGSNSTLDVSIVEDASTLTDVVIIGYQAVPKKNLSSSVSSIGAKDLKDVTLTSAAEALNGRLAGVTANTSEGSPDATVRIRVRGGISITQSNDPLFIVDGVQVENALNVIPPQDIQSIDVLKDAAATAIYGARGANGVFVITTKSGKPGRTVVSYTAWVGVKNLADKLAVMSPYDYVLYQYEISKRSTTDSASFLSRFGTTWDTLKNYQNVTPIDWQEEVMGRTGVTTTHNLSVSGGKKNLTYNLGYTFNKEKPIVINSDFLRHVVSLRADYKFTPKIKLTVGGRYTYQDVTGAGVSSENNTSFARLRNAVKYRPFFADSLDIDEADPLVINPGNGVALVNPVALANAEFREKTTNGYNANATLSINITKRLSFRSTFGFDRNDFVDMQFWDSITSFSVNQGSGRPIARLDTAYRKSINNSNVLQYSVKGWKKKHDFDILAGEETYELKTDNRSGQFQDFPKYTTHQAAFEQNLAIGKVWAGFPQYSKARYTSLSFFGRINYAFMDRYLLSLNGRYDGSSKFSPDNRWGFFPSFSLAWRVKKESFMENVDFINDLKFRFGWGKVGNNRIGDYLYLTTFNYGQNGFYALNNTRVDAYIERSLANTNLTWEALVNRNYGVDVSLLKGRIDFTFDVYNNTSDKLLLNAKIAPTYGFTDQLQNIGKTKNRGWELQTNAAILRKPGGFNWSANFNISHNENTVVELAKGQTEFAAGPSWGISGQPTDYIVRIGAPVGSIYGWITDGFYKVEDFDYDPVTTFYNLKAGVARMAVSGSNVVPGALRFKDISGPNGVPDGVINDFDKTIIGNPTPKFTGGLNQTFTYKSWDASIFVNFSYGNDIFNANKIEFTSAYNVTSNLLDIVNFNNRWRTVDANGKVLERFSTPVAGGPVVASGVAPAELAAANANATIWMPAGLGAFGSGGANFSYYTHSWAIEDGSFLRLNNITVGYTLPIKSVKRIGLSKLRFYVTANNLAVITNYSGYDPEVSVRSSGLTPGLDYSAFPKSKGFVFGLNANF